MHSNEQNQSTEVAWFLKISVMFLQLIKYFKIQNLRRQASEQERKGEGSGQFCLLYIAFKLPSPHNFNSLPVLHAHVTGLKFSGKRTKGPLEKHYLFNQFSSSSMKQRYFVSWRNHVNYNKFHVLRGSIKVCPHSPHPHPSLSFNLHPTLKSIHVKV